MGQPGLLVLTASSSFPLPHESCQPPSPNNSLFGCVLPLSSQPSSQISRTAGEQCSAIFHWQHFTRTVAVTDAVGLGQGQREAMRGKVGNWFFFAGSGYALDPGHGRWVAIFCLVLEGAPLLRPFATDDPFWTPL